MAELFYNVLCAEQSQEYVVGVFDRRKQGKFQGLPIIYPQTKVFQDLTQRHPDGGSVVLVTPSYETDEIKEELRRRIQKPVEVLTLKELLE